MRESFGQRLRPMRERANLAQWEVAKELGISDAQLNHVEKGRRLPTDPEQFARDYEGAVRRLLLSAIRGREFVLREMGHDSETVTGQRPATASEAPAAQRRRVTLRGIRADRVDEYIEVLREAIEGSGQRVRIAKRKDAGRPTYRIFVAFEGMSEA